MSKENNSVQEQKIAIREKEKAAADKYKQSTDKEAEVKKWGEIKRMKVIKN